MKYYELDSEEQNVLDAVEGGEFVKVVNFEEEKRRIAEIAKTAAVMNLSNKNL